MARICAGRPFDRHDLTFETLLSTFRPTSRTFQASQRLLVRPFMLHSATLKTVLGVLQLA